MALIDQSECHGLDTPEDVYFYEQDFYVLSNFSSFQVKIWGMDFATSEHAYHWAKFAQGHPSGLHETHLQATIRTARSAHEAFKLAQENKQFARRDWDEIKLAIMKKILLQKVDTHAYVYRKLLATGDRQLIENSWRDDVWGWGPNRDGQNMLGKLWMEIRAEIVAERERDRAAGRAEVRLG